ncbi:MAG TPA: WG repeat-containing protein [Symbiobacteriaceae bacterium]|nr:WG repeat-containing protein [Symbiobacteriaceae bacterium]
MHRQTLQLIAAMLILALTGCASTTPKDPGDTASVVPPAPTPPIAGEPPTPPAPPKQERQWRYPAYQLQEGKRQWGYVDASGSFVIGPQFETAEEFGPDGLAVVHQNGKAGLIDLTGTMRLPPEANFITGAADGIRLAYYGDTVKAIDANGKALFDATGIGGRFESGLAPFARDNRYGYLDKAGAVAIEPQFTYANSFVDGHAVVRLPDGSFAIIDTKGTEQRRLAYDQVAQLSEGVVAFRDRATQQWGYTSLKGDVEIPAQFTDAQPFSGGFAIVNAGEMYTAPAYGVMKRQGQFVIPAKYGHIQDLGNGLFAAAQRPEEPVPPDVAPHAIFAADGQQLTAFRFYDVLATSLGLSVSDETETYFLDRQGRRAAELPSAQGIGTMRAVGELIAMQIDGRLSYVTREGQTIWKQSDSWPLSGGVSVAERKHRQGRDLLIYYPEVIGLPDAKVQATINQRLNDLFLGPKWGFDGDIKQSIHVSFAVQQVGKVLVVERTGNIYPLGAAHGTPLMDYYHFDLTTGKEYGLADLFRIGSDYPARLRELVRQQLAVESRGLNDLNPVVRPDHPFATRRDHLFLYWDVYEIAPYAAGFPSFDIPYGKVSDLINIDGAFWKALGR